jgi:hypothetical protein
MATPCITGQRRSRIFVVGSGVARAERSRACAFTHDAKPVRLASDCRFFRRLLCGFRPFHCLFLWRPAVHYRARRRSVEPLIGVAITVAFVYSCAVVFGLAGKVFFWSWSPLSTSSLGHWIEMKSVIGVSALEKLVRLLPAIAHCLKASDGTEDIPCRVEARRSRAGKAARASPDRWRHRERPIKLQ